VLGLLTATWSLGSNRRSSRGQKSDGTVVEFAAKGGTSTGWRFASVRGVARILCAGRGLYPFETYFREGLKEVSKTA
jgi:hypothetical protein